MYCWLSMHFSSCAQWECFQCYDQNNLPKYFNFSAYEFVNAIPMTQNDQDCLLCAKAFVLLGRSQVNRLHFQGQRVSFVVVLFCDITVFLIPVQHSLKSSLPRPIERKWIKRGAGFGLEFLLRMCAVLHSVLLHNVWTPFFKVIPRLVPRHFTCLYNTHLL